MARLRDREVVVTGSKRKLSKSPTFRSHRDGLLAPLDALILPDVPSTPYTAEIEQDELILAAIIAGGVASGRKVMPATTGSRPAQEGHTNSFGVSAWADPQGPCCAVGAGILYAGIDPETVSRIGSCSSFADAYGVSYGFASGVSDGFEGGDREWSDRATPIYDRGVAVGSAAYDFFQGDS
jgi:hypothetical protein